MDKCDELIIAGPQIKQKKRAIATGPKRGKTLVSSFTIGQFG